MRLSPNPRPVVLGVRCNQRLTFGGYTRQICQTMQRLKSLLRAVGARLEVGIPLCCAKITQQCHVPVHKAKLPGGPLESLQQKLAGSKEFRLRQHDRSCASSRLPLLRVFLLKMIFFPMSPALDLSHSEKQLIESEVWRSSDLPTLTNLNLQSHFHHAVQSCTPWHHPPSMKTLFTPVYKTMPVQQQLERSHNYLTNLLQSNLLFVTDGSAVDGTDNGSAGPAVLCHDTVIHQWNAPTGSRSSYLHSESVAFDEALNWLSSYNEWTSAMIVCD